MRGVADGSHAMINSQAQVGGWPPLAGEPPPKDSDHDGMPDAWEKSHARDPTDAHDGNGDRDNDGYTNLEEYLNSLVAISNL